MTGPDAPCPCGLPAAYAACCGRYHGGALHLQAPTAEALMRSRYCAYALSVPQRSWFRLRGVPPGNAPLLADYLLATWHAHTRPSALEPAPPGLQWLGLEVRRTARQDATHATVEFVARSRLGGRAQRLHEVSRFAFEGGRWLYIDGELR